MAGKYLTTGYQDSGYTIRDGQYREHSSAGYDLF